MSGQAALDTFKPLTVSRDRFIACHIVYILLQQPELNMHDCQCQVKVILTSVSFFSWARQGCNFGFQLLYEEMKTFVQKILFWTFLNISYYGQCTYKGRYEWENHHKPFLRFLVKQLQRVFDLDQEGLSSVHLQCT